VTEIDKNGSVKKIVEKKSINNLKQCESSGFQVPLPDQRLYTYKKYKKYFKITTSEVINWHLEPGTWNF